MDKEQIPLPRGTIRMQQIQQTELFLARKKQEEF
jgi:hypothetical protein